MALEPRQQRWTKVEAYVRIVVNVRSVALCVNAFIPVVVRRGSWLGVDRTSPGILARWLIKVSMNYKSSHIQQNFTVSLRSLRTSAFSEVVSTQRTQRYAEIAEINPA